LGRSGHLYSALTALSFRLLRNKALGVGEAEVRERGHERGFEAADEARRIALAVAEREDRVGDELARAVIGDVAAALDVDDRDVAGGDDVALLCCAVRE
jgi:hypothetical protein